MTVSHGSALDPVVVPCVRLFSEPVVVLDDDGFGSNYEEVDAPLIELSFRYTHLNRRVRASDPSMHLFGAGVGGLNASPRDFESEARARCLLESFGAVDIEALDAVGVPPDVEADYLVRMGSDRHEQCAFSAYALPQLRELGWHIEIDPSFPFQVYDGPVDWYADVKEDGVDWFALELGVEIGGQRVNLLPALVDLLDAREDGENLRRLTGRRCYALPVTRTHHITVDGDSLRALLRVLIELYDGSSSSTLRFELRDAPVLDALDEVMTRRGRRLRWHDTGGAREWGQQLAAEPEPLDGPVELQATLRPYQRVGLGWLQQLRRNDVGGVLADDMGLGKTLQTIAHIVTEKVEGRLDLPVLVVAPTSLMGNWEREIKRFAPGLAVLRYHGPNRHHLWQEVHGADVVLTSYPLLVREAEQMAEQPWHYVILDEAHAIKNRRSRVHRAAKGLEARHRLALTGTPMENHLGELWSLMDFLNPDMLGSQERFRHQYRTPIERFRDEERLLVLRDKVRPFILRRLKSEVATELPPKTELLRPVELSGKQRELYESIRIAAHAKVRNLIQRKGLAASTVPILDALMKLRQLCCDPRLVKMDAARFVRESAKYEAFFELIESQLSQGHRVLVFSQFTSMLRLLGQGLRERNTRYLELTGATKDRQGLCDRFESGEADVFLISLKAGGTGLNLTSADAVVHYDPWWNPQAQAQATDRAYRIGQQKPVFVYNLFVAGSVEERMLHLQRHKRRLADAILAGEVPDQPLSEEDIEVLLAG